MPAFKPGSSIDDLKPADPKPPLVKVDGTVPLPSDQLTPLVPAASTAPGAPAVMPSVVPPHASASFTEDDDRYREDRSVVSRLVAEDFRIEDYPADLVEQFRRVFANEPTGGNVFTNTTIRELRRDVLGSDREAIAPRFDEGLRAFPVMFDVNHNGEHFSPGGERIVVTFDEWERLRAGTSIILDWFDGEVR